MIQLIRRFRACESGAGTVEYGFLVALLALGLVVGLQLYRNAVGNLTNRTVVTISRQSARGYAGGALPGGVPAAAPRPVPPPEPEPQADEEGESETDDSTAAAGGAIKLSY